MRKQRWVVDSVREDGWSVLRRDVFIYTVPRDVLPEGLSEGDVLHSDDVRGEEYGRWTLDRRRAG